VELDEGLSMTYQQNRAVVIAGRMRSTFAAAMRALLRHPECVESIRDQVAHHLNHAYHVSTDFNRAIWESAYANDNGRHGNGKAKGSP
jgi:ribosomal protein L31E